MGAIRASGAGQCRRAAAAAPAWTALRRLVLAAVCVLGLFAGLAEASHYKYGYASFRVVSTTVDGNGYNQVSTYFTFSFSDTCQSCQSTSGTLYPNAFNRVDELDFTGNKGYKITNVGGASGIAGVSFSMRQTAFSTLQAWSNYEGSNTATLNEASTPSKKISAMWRWGSCCRAYNENNMYANFDVWVVMDWTQRINDSPVVTLAPFIVLYSNPGAPPMKHIFNVPALDTEDGTQLGWFLPVGHTMGGTLFYQVVGSEIIPETGSYIFDATNANIKMSDYTANVQVFDSDGNIGFVDFYIRYGVRPGKCDISCSNKGTVCTQDSQCSGCSGNFNGSAAFCELDFAPEFFDLLPSYVTVAGGEQLSLYLYARHTREDPHTYDTITLSNTGAMPDGATLTTQSCTDRSWGNTPALNGDTTHDTYCAEMLWTPTLGVNKAVCFAPSDGRLVGNPQCVTIQTSNAPDPATGKPTVTLATGGFIPPAPLPPGATLPPPTPPPPPPTPAPPTPAPTPAPTPPPKPVAPTQAPAPAGSNGGGYGGADDGSAGVDPNVPPGPTKDLLDAIADRYSGDLPPKASMSGQDAADSNGDGVVSVAECRVVADLNGDGIVSMVEALTCGFYDGACAELADGSTNCPPSSPANGFATDFIVTREERAVGDAPVADSDGDGVVSPAERVAFMDADGDGVVSSTETAIYWASDLDGDGVVSIVEFRAGNSIMGLPIVDTYPTAKYGPLSPAELLNVAGEGRESSLSAAESTKWFGADFDGDGRVTYAEYLAHFYKNADLDGDGTISEAERDAAMDNAGASLAKNPIPADGTVTTDERIRGVGGNFYDQTFDCFAPHQATLDTNCNTGKGYFPGGAQYPGSTYNGYVAATSLQPPSAIEVTDFTGPNVEEVAIAQWQDLNGDGVVDSGEVPPTFWLMQAMDPDGDGISQLEAARFLMDSDGDGIVSEDEISAFYDAVDTGDNGLWAGEADGVSSTTPGTAGDGLIDSGELGAFLSKLPGMGPVHDAVNPPVPASPFTTSSLNGLYPESSGSPSSTELGTVPSYNLLKAFSEELLEILQGNPSPLSAPAGPWFGSDGTIVPAEGGTACPSQVMSTAVPSATFPTASNVTACTYDEHSQCSHCPGMSNGRLYAGTGLEDDRLDLAELADLPAFSEAEVALNPPSLLAEPNPHADLNDDGIVDADEAATISTQDAADSNGDGVVSGTELIEFLDTDGDGEVSHDELLASNLIDLNNDGIISDAEADAALLADKDGDGFYSAEELAVFTTDAVDTDGDGSASFAELYWGLDSNGDGWLSVREILVSPFADLDGDGMVSAAEAKAINMMDQNGDGYVTDWEFRDAMAPKGDMGPRPDGDLSSAEALAVMDANGDGNVTESEAAAWFSMDLDGDGTVSVLEYNAAYTVRPEQEFWALSDDFTDNGVVANVTDVLKSLDVHPMDGDVDNGEIAVVLFDAMGNQDGVVDDSDAAAAFAALDTDGDGVITVSEMESWIATTLGIVDTGNSTEAADLAAQLLGALDDGGNGDGRVTYVDFINAVQVAPVYVTDGDTLNNAMDTRGGTYVVQVSVELIGGGPNGTNITVLTNQTIFRPVWGSGDGDGSVSDADKVAWCDTDGNGNLTVAEVRVCATLSDLDGDGRISEFEQLIIDAMDLDGDGYIDFNAEYTTALGVDSADLDGDGTVSAEEQAAQLDTNNDGKVSLEEVVVSPYADTNNDGVVSTEEAAAAMANLADADGDGVVTYVEVLVAMDVPGSGFWEISQDFKVDGTVPTGTDVLSSLDIDPVDGVVDNGEIAAILFDALGNQDGILDASDALLAFNVIDADGDGKITPAEMESWLVDNLGLSEADATTVAQQMLNALDAGGNGDGFISSSDFINAMQVAPNTMGEDDVTQLQTILYDVAPRDGTLTTQEILDGTSGGVVADLDKNGDGEVTSAEIAVFLADKDGDGTISGSEALQLVASDADGLVTEDSLANFFLHADTDPYDGIVSREEFLAYIIALGPEGLTDPSDPETIAYVNGLFDALDTDGSGGLDVEEMGLVPVTEAFANKVSDATGTDVNSLTVEDVYTSLDPDGTDGGAEPSGPYTARMIMDLDGDGTISSDEEALVSDAIDLDGDGFVSVVELEKLLEGVVGAGAGNGTSQEVTDLAKFIHDLLADDDGNVSLVDLVAQANVSANLSVNLENSLSNFLTSNDADEALDALDANGNGAITSAEIALVILDHFGDKDGIPTNGDAKAFIDAADADGDGEVSAEELTAFLQSEMPDLSAEDAAVLAETIISALDKGGNGDGALTLADATAAVEHAALINIDLSGDGVVSAAEVAVTILDVMNDNDGKLTMEDAHASFDLFDADGDGTVTEGEIAAYLESALNLSPSDAAELAKTIFDALDEGGDGNGVLKVGDFEAAVLGGSIYLKVADKCDCVSVTGGGLLQAGDLDRDGELSAEEAQLLIFDLDGDGVISEEEYKVGIAAIDDNNDGVVSTAEMNNFLKEDLVVEEKAPDEPGLDQPLEETAQVAAESTPEDPEVAAAYQMSADLQANAADIKANQDAASGDLGTLVGAAVGGLCVCMALGFFLTRPTEKEMFYEQAGAPVMAAVKFKRNWKQKGPLRELKSMYEAIVKAKEATDQSGNAAQAIGTQADGLMAGLAAAVNQAKGMSDPADIPNLEEKFELAQRTMVEIQAALKRCEKGMDSGAGFISAGKQMYDKGAQLIKVSKGDEAGELEGIRTALGLTGDDARAGQDEVDSAHETVVKLFASLQSEIDACTLLAREMMGSVGEVLANDQSACKSAVAEADAIASKAREDANAAKEAEASARSSLESLQRAMEEAKAAANTMLHDFPMEKDVIAQAEANIAVLAEAIEACTATVSEIESEAAAAEAGAVEAESALSSLKALSAEADQRFADTTVDTRILAAEAEELLAKAKAGGSSAAEGRRKAEELLEGMSGVVSKGLTAGQEAVSECRKVSDVSGKLVQDLDALLRKLQEFEGNVENALDVVQSNFSSVRKLNDEHNDEDGASIMAVQGVEELMSLLPPQALSISPDLKAKADGFIREASKSRDITCAECDSLEHNTLPKITKLHEEASEAGKAVFELISKGKALRTEVDPSRMSATEIEASIREFKTLLAEVESSAEAIKGQANNSQLMHESASTAAATALAKRQDCEADCVDAAACIEQMYSAAEEEIARLASSGELARAKAEIEAKKVDGIMSDLDALLAQVAKDAETCAANATAADTDANRCPPLLDDLPEDASEDAPKEYMALQAAIKACQSDAHDAQGIPDAANVQVESVTTLVATAKAARDNVQALYAKCKACAEASDRAGADAALAELEAVMGEIGKVSDSVKITAKSVKGLANDSTDLKKKARDDYELAERKAAEVRAKAEEAAKKPKDLFKLINRKVGTGKKFDKLYAQFDENGDGKLTQSETKNMLLMLHPKLDEWQLRHFMLFADTDGDKRLEKEELRAVIKAAVALGDPIRVVDKMAKEQQVIDAEDLITKLLFMMKKEKKQLGKLLNDLCGGLEENEAGEYVLDSPALQKLMRKLLPGMGNDERLWVMSQCWTIIDEDRDGKLSTGELLRVLERRERDRADLKAGEAMLKAAAEEGDASAS